MNSNINWDEVIYRKALGIDDYDLGEVQEVQENVVVTQKRHIRQRQILSYEKTGRRVRWSLSLV